MCENKDRDKDRPDLELERLVMGDQADGVRPSAEWLVREDVVRGAVERIKSSQDRTRQHGEDLQLAIARQNAALAEVAELRDQVEKLQAELAEAKRVAEAATAVYLKKFDADTATMELKSEAFKNLAEMAYSYAEACGMQNYVEATVKVGPLQAKDGEERFFVTLQRMDGKTPHELKVEAERERDELRDQVEALTASLEDEEEMVAYLRGRIQTLVDYVRARTLEDAPIELSKILEIEHGMERLAQAVPDGVGLAVEVDNAEGGES